MITRTEFMNSPFLKESDFGADGAHPPGRDGAAERGGEHDAATEVVVGQVCLLSNVDDSGRFTGNPSPETIPLE